MTFPPIDVNKLAALAEVIHCGAIQLMASDGHLLAKDAAQSSFAAYAESMMLIKQSFDESQQRRKEREAGSEQ